MKLFPSLVIACGLALAQPVHAQQLDVLVLGSTHSFSEGEIGQSGVVHEKPFNPTTIATRLQSILSQDALITGSVNVVFEDIYKTKSSVTVGAVTMNKDFRCYSLFQHMMWPDGKAARLSNLRGEAGTQWDYIIVCEDAYVMAHFPGMFAEGVKMLRNEVANSSTPAQIMLLAQWPESGSAFTADGFNQIVHRVGDSAGVPVVPAGKAWNSYGSKDTNTAHPTPKGQYLAAAAIHSKLFNRSASGSGYSYPSDGTNIANHAHSVVQANAGVTQYSGLYTTAHAFQMKYFRDRQVDWCENGTSTEEGFAAGLIAAYADARINHIRRIPPATGNPVDLHYSRGSDAYEPDKQYLVDAARFDRVHGFPMQHYADTGEVTMIYGIDKHYETNGAFENGSDLGVAYSMVREGEVPQDVRGIPVRLMWSKIDHFRPEIPAYSDTWHLHSSINHAVGAYMYTLLSGRCPVDVEPANPASSVWQLWYCRKVGYETAWQMAHLTTRAPGFRVTPSTTTRTTVTTTTPETMSVRFLNPPTTDVTVNVSISDPAVAMVSPSTLIFTPSNYNTPQTVTVTGKEITPVSAPFQVVYSTSSTDLSYHGLGDSWSYEALRDGSTVDLIAGFDGNNTSTISGSTKTLSNAHHGPDATSAGVTATLWTTDSMAKEFQWTGANQTSLVTWGTLTLIPSPVSLNTTNVATIAAPTTLNFTINNTAGTQSIDLQNLHFSAVRDAGATTQLTIAYASGNLAGTNGVATLVNDTGVNRGYDFDLTTILTDRILAPGETATFTIAQTTSEIARLRLDDIGISGEVLTSGPDTTAPNPDPMTWASEPTAENSSSITMTATTASDPSGVEYYFDETSGNVGGSDSGWQDSPAYTDSGLQADTQYTYTVTARDKAANPNTAAASAAASVTTSPASSPVSAGSSTVAASPTTAPADGATTSTITVTLKDFGGAPVSGKTVSLVSNGSATIQTSNNISNASGVVTFTVKSSTVGSETFTATGDGVTITQTASVNFQALPVSAGTSTVGASPSTAPADGATASTITVTLKNAGGGAVSGKTVSLASNGSATIQTTNNTSDASGVVNFTVKSSTVGTQIFTATGDGITITQTASVDFQTVMAISGLLAGFDGEQTHAAVAPATTTSSTGVRQLTGPKQDPGMTSAVSARIWTDQATEKSLQWAVQSISTTTGNWGLSDFTTDASTANAAWVLTVAAASWINYEITNTGSMDITLDKLHLSANRLNVTTTPSPDTLTVSLVQNGTFANPPVLSASALAASGTQTIALSSATGWNHYEFSLSSMLTDLTLAAGEKATFRIANNAGTGRLYLDNIAISGSVGSGGGGSDVTAPTPNPMTWASVPAAVNSTSITMTATTASDPSGVEYSFDETSGNPGGTDSGWQDGASYTDTGLSPGTQYTYTVTARDKAATPNPTTASSSASATTNAYVSPVSASTSTVAASPTAVPADGTTTSSITVTLKDSGGTAVSGKTVSLVSNGSATIQTSNSTSDTNGLVTFTVKSSTVGTQTFTATGDGITITQTASVDFQTVSGGTVNAGTSTVVASPITVPGDGSTASTITVTLRDVSGNPIANEGVSLENTSGLLMANITPVDIQSTNASGQATFAVRSTTAGQEVFSATAVTGGVLITQTASVTFTQVGAVYLLNLLGNPVASGTSDTTNAANVSKLYDTNMNLDYIGTRINEGGAFASSVSDTDGYTGDTLKSHTFVYDMGSIVTFDGFIHAQRHESSLSTVGSIQFWVSNTSPGSDFIAIANTWFGTTPHASKTLNRGDRNLKEYVLDGTKLTGRYVIMRWVNYDQVSTAGLPGGYTFLLGQTAAVGDYDTWRGSYPGLGALNADDDGDGLNNDAERAFGLNPLSPSSSNPFAVPFQRTTGAFSYTRRTQGLSGLTYKTWYSTDLVNWFWESGEIQTPRAPVGDVEIVDVTIDPDLLTEPKLFIKITAEDLGPAPSITSIWGANTTITMNFSEAMDNASAADPSNYSVQQDGGGSVSVTGATLSGDGKTATLTLGSALGIGSSFTVTTYRIANGVGQPLGYGTSGQFRTWDDNPNGIKVFILAGQSNMVGYGHTETGLTGDGGIGTLRYLAVNDSTYTEYNYASLLSDPSQPATSAWKTRSDVKVWWRNGASGNLGGPIGKGNLGPPFRGADTTLIGPEYAFGQILGDYYASDDVLIIKAAWGGHTLAGNFRPPGAVAARGGAVGASYSEIFQDAREVLDNLGTEFPEWAGRGYQIVGFAWHQGTSDKSPVERALEYKHNLPNLVADVRSEFGKPNLPFVIATTGMSGVGPVEPYPYPGYHDVEKAQLWVAGVAKPQKVLTSDTRGFWEEAAVSPRNQGFHWNGNARSYFRVGKALADDMVTLLSAP